MPLGTAGLQVADAQQVVDALTGRFDVAVHHGRRGGQVEQVRFVHHLDPGLHARFAGRDRTPHVGVEDFGPRTGERVESCGDQPPERLHRRESAHAGDVGYFGRSERMEPQSGVAPFERAEKLLVKFDAQLRMQAALQSNWSPPSSGVRSIFAR